MGQKIRGVEIERKFLLGEFPSHITDPGREIKQGYLTPRGASLEVRVRTIGRQRYLTLKTGSGMIRREAEFRISRRRFETIWPFTEGARLHKTRYHTEYHGNTIEIDRYHEYLEPLITAEVEFASNDEAHDAALPDWLGAEITGLTTFSNSNLARNGLPDRFNVMLPEARGDELRLISHAGVVPYRVTDGQLEVLCITSKSGKRWIVPKGIWEDGYTLPETAAMEAWEEAGVRGTVREEALGIFEDDRNGRYARILLYALMVGEEAEKWPEDSIRERKWMSLDEAAETVSCEPLAELMQELGNRLA